jgi:ribose transport system ATP-binding protein
MEAKGGVTRKVKKNNDVVLDMIGICKAFPGVQALDHVDFQVRRGKVHTLVGENGAGKSTLIKILSGACKKDEGKIFLNGREIEINAPTDSNALGIRTVYQELNLLPHLSIAENIFMENLPKRRFIRFIDRKTMYEKSSKILAEFGLEMHPRTWIQKLSVAERQMIEIARAMMFDASIIIFDEPTSSLTMEETKKLFEMIDRVKKKGVSIIYISHRLPEVMEVGDHCTVLRDGKYAGTLDVKSCSSDDLIELMLGKKLIEKFGVKVEKSIKGELLKVENLTTKGVFKDISFSLKEGEILGFAGLVGSGRTEVVKAIAGADHYDSGRIYVGGREVNIYSPNDAINEGICLLPEDRKNEGLCPRLSVKANMSLPSLPSLTKYGFIKKKKEKQIIENLVQKLDIKTPSINRWVQFLSGGNQQKTVVAKWLMMDAKIYIFDEPTRGIDVGAKTEVYNLIRMLAKNNKGVIVISTEIPEILAISDNIIVMCGGELTARLANSKATRETILYHATGHKDEESNDDS